MGRDRNKNAEHAATHLILILLRLQAIYDIAQLCALQGVTQTVLCPGSRCAPLTLAFSRHPEITCRTFSDERSAAFIALGIARQMQNPVSLVCTSGSAAYNFAPAVAEAFFQQAPLLIFTADRPAEWIDQWDGQTIRQNNLFGAHVKKSFTLPADYEHADARWFITRSINEAIQLSREFPQGPVHINVPLREPLYPAANETIGYSKDLRVVETVSSPPALKATERDALFSQLTGFTKVLLVAGQQDYHEGLSKSVAKFCHTHHAALVGDVISNLHGLPNTVRYSDTFLGQCSEPVKQSLAPELLITFGKSVISKNLKLFLRKYKPQHHWHIQPHGVAADTFQSLTKVVHTLPESFFNSMTSESLSEKFDIQKKENYLRLWEAEEHRTARTASRFFSESDGGEFVTLNALIASLPPRCNLHLANSMSVRYANFIGLTAENKGVHVFSNRGTSGIDGCTSTAVGHSLSSEVPNILVTGDMAFFYDRNAFWHTYSLPNLHVIVLNNHGGVIFNLIDGPGHVPERNDYFITTQKLNASHLAAEFNFLYLKLDSSRKQKNLIKDFLVFEGKTKILEVETTQEQAKKSFDHFKNSIKQGYET